ncbi:MAG: hypothetical protein WB988_08100 [Candidatus Nitrosopolaris sp.]
MSPAENKIKIWVNSQDAVLNLSEIGSTAWHHMDLNTFHKKLKIS